MHKQEKVFLLIASFFFGTLGIINLLGVSRFIDFSFVWQHEQIPLFLPLGIFVYPALLLCTNLIAEFYGRKKANFISGLGLLVNLWILFVLWLSAYLPPAVPLDLITHLPPTDHPDFAFFQIRHLTLGAIVGSTIAYLVTQFLEIYLFQFWKKKTNGKYLWLRFNLSAFCSQFVDTVLVVSITYFLTGALPGHPGFSVWFLILSCYFFKITVTLLVLPIFYGLVTFLRRFLGNNTPTSWPADPSTLSH